LGNKETRTECILSGFRVDPLMLSGVDEAFRASCSMDQLCLTGRTLREHSEARTGFILADRTATYHRLTHHPTPWHVAGGASAVIAGLLEASFVSLCCVVHHGSHPALCL
jgi:hypothetical protein